VAIILDQIIVEIKLIFCFLMIPISLVLVNTMTDSDKGYFIDSTHLFGKSTGKGFAQAQISLTYIPDQSAQNTEVFHWHQQTTNNNHSAGLWSAQSICCRVVF
jgi:hypothetical protein